MADLEDGLITGRGKKESAQMRKRFQECEVKVKALRNKNNDLQKQCDNDLLDGDIRAAIKSQTHFIENEISELKKCLEKLSKDFTDSGSKKKIKEICFLGSREMQRNKRIMLQFMNRVSESPSTYQRSSTHPFNKSKSQMDTHFHNHHPDTHIEPVKEVHQVFASEEMAGELKAEQKMLAQRNALLKELEEKNSRINQIMGEMGEIVGGEQKDLIDQMHDNMAAVRRNVQDANSEMDQAVVQQKKSRKKYICIISVIVVLLLIGLGLIYFLILEN